MKNALSFTKFLDTLGCRLRIGYYWSAKSDNDKRVIVTIWDDEITEGKHLIIPLAEPFPPWTKLPGFFEMKRHIELAKQGNVELLGVLCHPKDPNAVPRERAYYDDSKLLTLDIASEPDGVYVVVTGEVSVEAARQGPVNQKMTARPLALEDLAEPPPEGIAQPERVQATSTVFYRNAMVRNYVLKRANGRCEYCEKQGFLMSNGDRYLETHHILALSEQGADSVSNVIGLCPDHHKQAHFGVDAHRLNDEMTAIVVAKEQGR
jgi:5-methylcytosine-specific restriction protein A